MPRIFPSTDVMSKWKALPIPLQLLGASSGKNEKKDVPHALSQPVLLVER